MRQEKLFKKTNYCEQLIQIQEKNYLNFLQHKILLEISRQKIFIFRFDLRTVGWLRCEPGGCLLSIFPPETWDLSWEKILVRAPCERERESETERGCEGCLPDGSSSGEGRYKLCCDRKKEETVANLAMVTGGQYIYNLFPTEK